MWRLLVGLVGVPHRTVDTTLSSRHSTSSYHDNCIAAQKLTNGWPCFPHLIMKWWYDHCKNRSLLVLRSASTITHPRNINGFTQDQKKVYSDCHTVGQYFSHDGRILALRSLNRTIRHAQSSSSSISLKGASIALTLEYLLLERYSQL